MRNSSRVSGLSAGKDTVLYVSMTDRNRACQGLVWQDNTCKHASTCSRTNPSHSHPVMTVIVYGKCWCHWYITEYPGANNPECFFCTRTICNQTTHIRYKSVISRCVHIKFTSKLEKTWRPWEIMFENGRRLYRAWFWSNHFCRKFC